MGSSSLHPLLSDAADERQSRMVSFVVWCFLSPSLTPSHSAPIQHYLLKLTLQCMVCSQYKHTLTHSHWFRYHWNWHRNSMEGKGYETKVAVIYMQYLLAVNRPLVIHYIQQHPLAKYAFKCYESIFFRSFSSTGCLCISDHRKTRIIRLHQVSFPLWRLYRVLAHLTLSSGQTNLYHEYLCTHQTVKYKCEKLCMHAKHHFIFPSLEMFHYST